MILKAAMEKYLKTIFSRSEFQSIILAWLGIKNKNLMEDVKIITNKLVKVSSALSTDKIDMNFIANKALMLCDKEKLKAMFLDFDWNTTKQAYTEITGMQIKKTGNDFGFSSLNGSFTPTFRPKSESTEFENEDSSSINKNVEGSNDDDEGNNDSDEGDNNNKSKSKNKKAVRFSEHREEPGPLNDIESSRKEYTASSPPSSGIFASQGFGSQEEISQGDDIPELEEAAIQMISSYDPSKHAKQTLKIKLVITEIASSKQKRNLRKILVGSSKIYQKSNFNSFLFISEGGRGKVSCDNNAWPLY